MPTSQGVNALEFYSVMNVKISSSSACDIYLRVSHYYSVQLVGVLIHFNVQSMMVSPIIHLVHIGVFVML